MQKSACIDLRARVSVRLTQSKRKFGTFEEFKVDAIAETTVTGAELHDKLAALGNDSYTIDTCERYADMIAEIKELKAARRSVILAHNYQRPEIFEVADFIGDSLQLAGHALDVRYSRGIVFSVIHFMAS